MLDACLGPIPQAEPLPSNVIKRVRSESCTAKMFRFPQEKIKEKKNESDFGRVERQIP